MTAKQLKEKVIPHLSTELFPAGETVGWWFKTVQLDLEAKGLMERADTKPLTCYQN